MTASSTLARYYDVDVSRNGDVDLTLVEEPVDVAVREGDLVGPRVSVSTRAVLFADRHGELYGRAVDPIDLRGGALCFDPSLGGIRTRENRRARGAFNAVVAEANRFGMVNAYVHADIGMRYANGLLADLHAPGLPALHVVVGAHFGSQVAGYGEGDGDRRHGSLRPLSGGHYRLSTRTTGVPELHPVSPTGEIHLGPSRYRKPFAGRVSYLRNAAHNPAIIYHELGHHLCRHTADFRCNAERHADRQRNGKPGIEEGVCDYFAATLLGSERPYGWYRADRGRRRDLHELRRAVHHDDNPHAVGAAWAAALWRCRVELLDAGILDAPTAHDRMVIDLLLRVSEIGRGGKRRTRARRSAQRCDPSTIIPTYLAAVNDAAGPRAKDLTARIFERAGLFEPADVGVETASC